MTTLEKRIAAFSQLGKKINQLSSSEIEALAMDARKYNSWFTLENIQLALQGIVHYLDKSMLEAWIKSYSFPNQIPQKNIGIVMAGNIPLVGFHDFLSVLITGNKAHCKLSSEDPLLLKKITSFLLEIEPEFEKFIFFSDQLKNKDAMIATGSNNSARYFESYFSNIPHIIRKNRSSIAILNGKETKEDICELGKDIFYYFGLGCRNVSKLFIPSSYDLTFLIENLQSYSSIIHHHKYINNYDYRKSIYLINQITHLDNGFLLLKEDEQLASPISILFYETYLSQDKLDRKIESYKDQIQCIVSRNGWYPKSVPFGKSQFPALDDYADGIDTIQFLNSL